MKKNYRAIIYGAILSSAIILYGFYSRKHPATKAMPGFAVVELFTSEGCSSCPAADKLAGIIESEKIPDVYLLSFHVDYWNRLGWKDVFSNSLYSERQKEYAAAFHLKSIYTPQMIVNGKTEFVGSDENKLRQAIQRALKNSSATNIDLRVRTNDDGKKVTMSCNTGNNTTYLSIALVQKLAETSVKNGENAGRFLKHFNVVRDFKRLTAGPGLPDTVTLSIPDGLSLKDLKVIAYSQNINDLTITGAIEKDLR